MGYDGIGGLGKNRNGITSPISIEKKSCFNMADKQDDTNNVTNRVTNNVKTWPKGTTLITGDSILTGVMESRLSKYMAKVRSFPGATVDDMFDYLLPLLKKQPTNIILHVGSNDCPFKGYQGIVNELMNLRTFIQSVVPGVKIFLSCPVIRTDNSKANRASNDLITFMKTWMDDIITHDKIDVSCLGKKGLHLNPKGSGRLATSFISLMQRL